MGVDAERLLTKYQGLEMQLWYSVCGKHGLVFDGIDLVRSSVTQGRIVKVIEQNGAQASTLNAIWLKARHPNKVKLMPTAQVGRGVVRSALKGNAWHKPAPVTPKAIMPTVPVVPPLAEPARPVPPPVPEPPRAPAPAAPDTVQQPMAQPIPIRMPVPAAVPAPAPAFVRPAEAQRHSGPIVEAQSKAVPSPQPERSPTQAIAPAKRPKRDGLAVVVFALMGVGILAIISGSAFLYQKEIMEMFDDRDARINERMETIGGVKTEAGDVLAKDFFTSEELHDIATDIEEKGQE